MKDAADRDSEMASEEENTGKQDAENEESPEKREEAKLMTKYGGMGGLPSAKTPSAFLQKRLNQRKFFDSGDYAMAKAKGVKPHPGGVPGVGGGPVVGGATAIPTPADAHQAPKQQKPILNVVVDSTLHEKEELELESGESAIGCEIPRPDTVPQRKSSIIYPLSASKLSPQPLHHHPTSPGETLLSASDD